MKRSTRSQHRGRGHKIVAGLLVGLGLLLMTAEVIEPALSLSSFVLFPLIIIGGLAMIIGGAKMSGCW